MLNLSRLNLLSELAVLGSISKVADAVNLTRPAVSQQLAILEQEVGTTLFERSSRGVTLTGAGADLVVQSKQLFAVMSEIESGLAAARGSVAGEVKIAAFGSVATTLIPPTIKQLQDRYPSVDLRFEELDVDECLKAAASKQVDIALVDESVSAHALANMLYFREVYEDRFAAVLSSSHPLATCATLNIAQLSSERWIMNRSSQTHKVQIGNACHAAGFSPHVVASLKNFDAMLNLVRTGCAITVLPELALHGIRHDPAIKITPIEPLVPRRIFAVMTQGTFQRPTIAKVFEVMDAIAAQLMNDSGPVATPSMYHCRNGQSAI